MKISFLSQLPLRFHIVLGTALCLLLTNGTDAQTVRVNYTFLAEPSNDCENGFKAGDQGYVDAVMGVEKYVYVGLNSLCEYGCFGDTAAISFSATLANSCHVLSIGTDAGHIDENNDTFFVDCDGGGPFTVKVNLQQYAGFISNSACNGSVPINSSASVWYVPPGTNVPGGIPFQTVTWSLGTAPAGTHLVATASGATLFSGSTAGTARIIATDTNSNCSIATDLQIVDPRQQPSCSGNCGGGGNGGRGQSPPIFGGAWHNIQSVPAPAFDMNLGSLWRGGDAQSLRLDLTDPGSLAHTAEDLSLPWTISDMEIYRGEVYEGLPDMLKQIRVPEGLVQIQALDASDPMEPYFVRFYSNTNIGVRGSNGYAVSGTPLVSWKIQNPGLGEASVRVTEERTGEANRVFTYTWDDDHWTLTRPDATTEWNYPGDGIHMLTDTNGYTNQFTVQQYTSFHGMTRLASETRGLDNDAHTTTFEYYTNGLLKQLVRGDGSWEYHVYDAQLRPIQIFSASGDQGVTNDSSLCRLIEHSYETNWLGATGDTGTLNPASPRRTVEYLLDQVVSCTYFSHVYSESREIRCVGGTNIAGAGNLTNITRFYTNGYFYSQPLSIERPDGTMDIFQYTPGVLTTSPGNMFQYTNYTNIVLSGVPNANKDDILNGTRTVTVKGPLGQVLSETTTDIQSTLTIDRRIYGAFDVYARPQAVTNLDGTWEFSQRLCCGDIITTNREGTVTSKTYDALRRLLTTTTAGIMHSNVYDAAGNILKVIRIGSNTNQITLEENGYDTAGHRIATTNAVGNVTLFEEALGAGGFTNFTTRLTNGGSGPSRIEARYFDGTTKSISGGLAHPVRYEYGAYATNGGGTFTKEIKLDANGDPTAETVITLYDLLGRPARTIYGDGAFSQTFYNAKGQATNQIDPDGVSTITLYNAKGEPSFTVIDMDRDEEVDWGGTDRITWTTNYVVNNGVADVHRTETRVWATNSTDSSTLVSVTDSAVSGLTSWRTNFALVTRSDSVFSGSGTRWSTNTAPDGTVTISQFVDGRALSVRRTNHTGIALSHTTFGYDEHGRQQYVTDARNGTTTNTFDAAGRVVSVSTPAPDSVNSAQVTRYAFDKLGRVIAVTNADSTVLYKEYFDSGELKKTYGSRTYPVEYTYDAQGRMRTMKTWQNFANNAGPAITTWNYDAYRGFMTNKLYSDGRGPHYEYTLAGELYRRTWARGVITTYSTDAAGEVASIDYSDGTPNVAYIYDRLGRRTNIVDGAGIHILSFDLEGNLLAETNTAGILAGIAVTNGYDLLERRFALGLVSEVSTLVNYGYDGASRIIAVTNGVNTASYSYIANSPLVEQITFKNSGTTRMTTTKSYDFLNRLLAVTNSPSADSPVVFNYANNTANQPTSITNADGSRWVYTYDALGQVTSGKKYWIDGTPVLGQQFEYTFDDIGNRKTAVSGGDEWGRFKRTQTYVANDLNQYAQRTVPGYLDITGTATNTATVTVNSGPTARKDDHYRGEVTVANASSAVWQSVTNTAVSALGANDMVTNAVGNLFIPQTPEAFGYDADGNMTNDGRWRLIWDAENRLVQMQSLTGAPVGSSNRLTFAYDSQGRRITKVVEVFLNGNWSGVSSNRYVYDMWNLIAQVNETNGAVVNSLVWGVDNSGSLRGAGGVGGLLITAITNGGVHFVGYDANGNLNTLVSATNGALTATYEFDVFGGNLRSTGPIVGQNLLRFSTKFSDDETGLLYYGHRFYHVGLGRWLSRDPIDEVGGINLYGFAHNSPVQFVDADGRFVVFLFLLGGCASENCCCCAEDIKIENVRPHQRGANVGHQFDTVINLQYVRAKERTDCKLKWLEKTNQGYTKKMRKQNNVWYDMTQDPETKESFGSWKKRKRPCPGTESVRDTDLPMFPIGKAMRTLEFRIVVESGAKCPCQKKSVEVTARQTIDGSQFPLVQRFETPAP